MLGTIYTGPNLTGSCPNVDYSALDPNTITDRTTLLCYQKYMSDSGLQPSDMASGTSGPSVAGAGTSGGASAAAKQGAAMIGANPASLRTPQPGAVAVDPGSGLFAKVFNIVAQGATPYLQAQVLSEAQKAQAAKQPVYVPQPVVQQAQHDSLLKSPWVIGAGGVVVIGILALIITLARKR